MTEAKGLQIVETLGGSIVGLGAWGPPAGGVVQGVVQVQEVWDAEETGCGARGEVLGDGEDDGSAVYELADQGRAGVSDARR